MKLLTEIFFGQRQRQGASAAPPIPADPITAEPPKPEPKPEQPDAALRDAARAMGRKGGLKRAQKAKRTPAEALATVPAVTRPAA